MAIYLNPEAAGMFLMGVGLVSLARFGRLFFKKHGPDKTLLSDNVKKLRLRDSLKLKLESLQKKGEKLILDSKKNIICKRNS
jgi:hypothetical protein